MRLGPPARSRRTSREVLITMSSIQQDVRPSAAALAMPAGGGPRRGGRRKLWWRRAPLLPALIFMIVITQAPFVATVVISTLKWNAFVPGAHPFIGIDNYKAVFTDPTLRQAAVNSIIYTVAVVLISVVLGLIIATLLDRKFLGRGLVRTMMIAPFLIVPVAAALLWKHSIFNPNYGLLNGVLTWLGQLVGSNNPPQTDFITSQPKLSIIIPLVWQWTPFEMLILLAGLQSQPRDPLEAAKVDGASNWQAFRYITFPHLRNYVELAILLGAIYIVQNFDYVFTITSGGLGTQHLPYAVYNTLYTAEDYGQASSEGVLVVIGSIIVGTFALRVVSNLFKQEGA
jgi:sorbitol/mannitol transport system permease protein